MQRSPIQLSLSALLIVVFGAALNFWLFRFGMLAGILGLSLTKHIAIAWLCQVIGVDRRARTGLATEGMETAPHCLPHRAAGGRSIDRPAVVSDRGQRGERSQCSPTKEFRVGADPPAR